MTIRKVIAWGLVIFIAWFIISDPHGAAHAATSLLNTIKGVGNSLSQFFNSL